MVQWILQWLLKRFINFKDIPFCSYCLQVRLLNLIILIRLTFYFINDNYLQYKLQIFPIFKYGIKLQVKVIKIIQILIALIKLFNFKLSLLF